MLLRVKLILILSLLLLGVRARSETLAFRSDYYCPYICDPQTASPGYMVEILKSVFSKEGIGVDVKITNWARSIKETRANVAQGLISTSKGDAPDLIYPTKPLGTMRAAFYTHKKSTWNYEGLHSLVNTRIGVINGYWYGEDLDRLLKSRHKSFLPFSGIQPLEQILKMVLNKRLEGFIENAVVLNYTLAEKKIPSSEFKQAGWVAIEDPYLYVAFSPKNPKSKIYALMLSKGIEDLRRSGELRQILDKYHLKDWETDSSLTLDQLNNFSPGILESALNLLDVIDTRRL